MVTKEKSERLVATALGESKADLLIAGGTLVNVYSGELLERVEIAVVDGRICYVGPSAAHTRGDRTELLDARGLYVSPGFIDGHTHIGAYCRPFESLQAYLPHGTTSVVATCDELATVFGFRGLELFLEEVAAHPLRVYTLLSMVAPQDPLLCSTAVFTEEEVAAALADPRVLGMGEIVSWLRLTQRDGELLARVEMAHRRGRIIHGHTAGARDRKLCAIASAGISSCHEPIRAEEALERLRLGYWTMLREGSLRQDLEATLKPLIARGVSLERVILVTDSMSPDDVAEHGHMDHVIRRAIALGLDPVRAIRSVTLHPATYCGLDQEIGGIAPGRLADIVFLSDLERVRVETVVIGGHVVARNGSSLVSGAPMALPAGMTGALRLRPDVTAERFKIRSPLERPTIRVIELVNQTITAERIVAVTAAGGQIGADLDRDLLKIAMFDRHGTGAVALGFITGFGARLGAVGLTTNLDENTLMVVGGSDEAMALCANALIETGGGIALADRGAVLERIDFPFAGIFSLEPWREVGKKLARVQRRLRDLGARFDKPLFALSFLPFVTLPALRITARGIVDVKRRKIVSLFADGTS
ncbi:MAG TPA: adenine deaminase C-terminal domain-containing protein [Candidatus Eisenbacteria bacterium]|nr:adenine deaminase C-terminal domain-containing protein [Candidatus Eisenbacteria bacterium]